MRNYIVKGLALAVAAFLIAVALSAPANADARIPGGRAQVLWTYYETTEPLTVCPAVAASFASVNWIPTFLPPDPDGCNNGGRGDNIIRLINPNGAANASLGSGTQPVCAMIYVFDDDEEMGECCGCPLTSAQLATFSVEKNLTSNWGLQGGPEGGDHGNGAIAIVATGQNPNLVSFVPGLSNGHGCLGTQSGACNVGCDPTNNPGYDVTTTSNLFGSITHNQTILGRTPPFAEVTGITETELSDDGGGDAINLTYLKNQCGALVGNGTGGGICNCPVE